MSYQAMPLLMQRVHDGTPLSVELNAFPAGPDNGRLDVSTKGSAAAEAADDILDIATNGSAVAETDDERALSRIDQMVRAQVALFPILDRAAQDLEEDRPIVSEDLLATAYVQRFGEDVRYCEDVGIFLVWNGIKWEESRGTVIDDMRRLGRELTADCGSNDRRSAGRFGTVAGALKFVAADPAITCDNALFDANPFLLGTQGGTVDLKTGELRPARRDDYISTLTAVAPSETADCPKWLRFLREATCGDDELVRFLRQICGYCLTGTTREHAIFFVYGAGGNGKSVFLNTLQAILGDYAVTAPMTLFNASKFDQHPTELAMLRGARLVSASETEEGRAWAEAKVKQLTGGDRISARRMRQDFFSFTPRFKVVIIGNHKPRLNNPDEAMRRRFNMLPFTNRPACPNKNLENELRAELPAIFRWAIDGCLDWQENGLVRPQCVQALTDEYFEDQNVFGQWLEEKCHVDKGNNLVFETVAALFKSWKAFAEVRNVYVRDTRSFGDTLAKAGFRSRRETINGKTQRVSVGVALLAEGNLEDAL